MTNEQINQAGAIIDTLMSEAPVNRKMHFSGLDALKKLLEKASLANALNKELDNQEIKYNELLKKNEELNNKLDLLVSKTTISED